MNISLRSGRGMLLIAAALFTVLSVIRLATDSPDLTSSGTAGATLRLAVPILLAALGGLFAERAGVVNIGLEGMMILGTWFGAWGAWQFNPWAGVAIGILGGMLGGLVHAIATVTFGVDHIISGVAINIMGAGLARFLSVVVYDGVPGAGATQSPQVPDVGDVSLPILSGGVLGGWESPNLFGDLETRGWFLVSDLAGVLGGMTRGLSWITILALAFVPLSWFVLWRTTFGLRLRSVGERPEAAESLGVSVYRMKYAGVVISGGLAGLAGAFLVIEASSIYREGQTGGRGFIGLAAMIFGNWRPSGALLGSLLFGFFDALQLRNESSVHALLLLLALGLAVGAIYRLVNRKWIGGAVLAALTAATLVWYFSSDVVPSEFVGFTPHIATLVVLASATQRLRGPAAAGLRYRRGGAH